MELSQLLSKLKTSCINKKIVFTNGCFDILHVGHVRYLKEAKSLGDVLVVGLDTDEGVRQIKGSVRPIQNQKDRAEILLALSSVDYVCYFAQANPIPLIEALRPDVLVKGGDWPIKKILGSELVRSYGGEVKSLSFTEGKSTTQIIEKMN